MVKREKSLTLIFTILISIMFSLSVLAGDLLPLQGNVDLSGTPVSSSGLVVEIWDGPDFAGSNLIYNSTENFTGSANISSGKFDIVLGSVGDELNLEYGKVYYMDLFIAGNNMNFSGQERQVFMSSVGTINSSFLNTSNDYEVNSLLIDNKTAISNAYLNISDGVSSKFIVGADGKVGIGTSTPTQELNIIGDANITSNIIIEQNLTVQGDNSSFAGNISVSKDLIVDSEVYLNQGGVFRSLLSWLGLIENDIYLNATERIADNTTLTGMISAINADAYNPANIAFLNESELNASFVRRIAWADHDNYPDACPSGQYVTQIGDTLTCSAPGAGDLSNYAVKNDSETFTKNVTVQDSLSVSKIIQGAGNFIVDASGNVGIGTASPSGKLEVYGNQININDASWAQIQSLSSSLDIKTYGGQDISFTQSSSEVMRMKSGNVGIGTTSPTKTLDVWGTVNMSQLTAASGTPSTLCRNLGEVTVNPALTCTVSSKVFKDNIVQLKNGEENRLMQLNVSSFEFKTETGKTHYGLIAEDVVKIYPELGRYDENGTLVTYEIMELIPLLLRGYQDQQTQIEDLKSENDLLKSELCRKDGSYSWCGSKIAAEQPVNETLSEIPSEQTPEVPVESPVTSPLETPIVNSVPVIDSFMPEVVPVMSVGDSQEFTITSSDADVGDVLSLQWFVNDLAVEGQTSGSFEYWPSEAGVFEVKVLVTDGKDYSTHKWVVTVGEGRSFSITGAAVGVAKQGVKQGSSLLDWIASLFS